MTTGDGSSIETAVQKLSGLLSEQSPTDSHEAPTAPASQEDAETLQSDTEQNSRRVNAKFGDIDVEFEVLTEGVDLDLIPKGLMMESDYRKKTMSLAEERKAFAEQQSKFDEKVKDLELSLQMDVDDLSSPEFIELKEIDPEAYLSKFETAQKKSEKLKKYRADVEKRKQEEKQKKINEQFAKWSEAVPEWLDSEVMEKDVKNTVKTLRDAGFDDDEMKDFYDHRLMAVFRKAALYDQVKSTSAKAKQKASAPKSTAPAAKLDVNESRQEFNKSLNSLKTSGRMSDAQAAIKKLLM